MLSTKEMSLHFEDDITIHNRLLETISNTIETKNINQYDLDTSIKAVKAVAELIAIKANKQRDILLSSIVNCSSSVEIMK